MKSTEGQEYEMWDITVLGSDPVPKERPRTVRRGGKVVTFTPPATRDWEATVGWYAKAHCKQPRSGNFEVTLTFFRKSNRMVDLDNLSKAVLDALNGMMWHDDRQVVALHLYKRQVDKLDNAGVRIVAEVVSE